MRSIWTGIQIAFSAIGGFIGWLLGGFDGFLYALIAFAVIDYITGVMCAITDKNLFRQKALKRSGLQRNLPQGAHLCACRHRQPGGRVCAW